jgi:hypothetical protein
MSQPTAGHLVDLTAKANGEARDRLDFQWQPLELKNTVGVKWAENDVPGFSHRRMQYVGGGAQLWQFKLQFFQIDEDEGWARDKINWLKSFLFGEYDENGKLVAGPRHLLLVWGDFLSVEGVLKAPFVPTYSLFQPVSKLPRMAEVDVTIEEFVSTSRSFSDVRT